MILYTAQAYYIAFLGKPKILNMVTLDQRYIRDVDLCSSSRFITSLLAASQINTPLTPPIKLQLAHAQMFVGYCLKHIKVTQDCSSNETFFFLYWKAP